jgi:hypothetical protein
MVDFFDVPARPKPSTLAPHLRVSITFELVRSRWAIGAGRCVCNIWTSEPICHAAWTPSLSTAAAAAVRVSLHVGAEFHHEIQIAKCLQHPHLVFHVSTILLALDHLPAPPRSARSSHPAPCATPSRRALPGTVMPTANPRSPGLRLSAATRPALRQAVTLHRAWPSCSMAIVQLRLHQQRIHHQRVSDRAFPTVRTPKQKHTECTMPAGGQSVRGNCLDGLGPHGD